MNLCAFCGPTESPITREDVWPVWLVKILPRAQPKNQGHLIRRVKGSPGKIWRITTPKMTVRSVCKQCNNGWMSELEGRAKPILTPILIDQPRGQLSLHERAVVAMWIYKTSMTLDLTGIGDTFTASERVRFSDTLDLPDWFHVWIGIYRGSETVRWAFAHRSFRRRWWKCEARSVTVSVGHLAFQLLGIRYVKRRHRVTPVEASIWEDAVPKIWPPLPTQPILQWPPLTHLTDNGFDELVRRWGAEGSKPYRIRW
jgi:hypothetical protein